jgi:hypothetical protein
LIIAFNIISCQDVYAVDEFTVASPAGTDNLSQIDDKLEDNNTALVRGITGLRSGAKIVYASASTLTVETGQVICSNSAGTIIKTRRNTSNVTVTWSDLDTGSETASQTYYVYATADTSIATFPIKISTNSTGPSGVTYYLRLGSFFNNSSSNIERIENDYDLSPWEIDGTETQLKQADAIDLRSQKIINLATCTADADAAPKAYVDDTAGVAAGSITQSKLATTTGEVSTAVDQTLLTLPGGSYGFYPQIKTSASDSISVMICGSRGSVSTPGTSYITTIECGDLSSTFSAQQRYVTATGIDHWIFLLIDKTTKEILSAWEAPDHPSYGNGGDYMALPHPFLSYDKSKHNIVLVEDEQRKELQQSLSFQYPPVSLLTLINEDYRVDWNSAPKYVPLHTGKFLGEEPILVPELPSYIKMKSLIKLTDAEKVAKEDKAEAEREKVEQDKIKKEADKQAGKEALKNAGLTDDMISALLD